MQHFFHPSNIRLNCVSQETNWTEERGEVGLEGRLVAHGCGGPAVREGLGPVHLCGWAALWRLPPVPFSVKPSKHPVGAG